MVEIQFVMENHVEAWSIKEFKTSKAARAHEKRLIARGSSVLFQTGKLVWMTPEEYEEELKTLPKAVE